jgi:hypothetical protein
MILAPALMLTLTVAVAACGSSSSSSAPAATTSPTATASPSASATSTADAVAEITANWEKFFSSSTPTAQRATLLQNGSTFSSAIAGLIHLVSGLGATVTHVTLTSPTAATVTYTITSHGSSLLKDQTGQAVYADGVWKVGDATLCGLLKLVPGGSTPAACHSAG